MSLGIVKIIVKIVIRVPKLMLGNVKIVIKYGQNYYGLSKLMLSSIVKMSANMSKLLWGLEKWSFKIVKIVSRECQITPI